MYIIEPMEACQKCGIQRPSLHGHHIIPRSQGGVDDPTNILRACANCHADIHGGLFGGNIGGAVSQIGRFKPGARAPRYRRAKCSSCRKTHWIHRHHIIPRSKGGSDDPSNLIDVCSNCHEDIHEGPAGANLRRDPEIEAKRAAAVQAKWADPKWKAKHLAEMRESLKSVDHKAKGRKTAAAWTPEKRAAHAARIRAIKLAQGITISEEQRRQTSETLKRKYADGTIINPMLGKKTSDEAKRKQSLVKLGKPRAPRKPKAA